VRFYVPHPKTLDASSSGVSKLQSRSAAPSSSSPASGSLKFGPEPPPTNLATLRLSVGDNVWHAAPGMKLSPQYHMPSLFVDEHNPPPAFPSDVHRTYAWFRGPRADTVQQGMVAHARPELKDPSAWIRVSTKRTYTPTVQDSMHILKFVIYAEHKPGRALSSLGAISTPISPPPESTGPVTVCKYIYFVAPSAKTAPMRKMTERKTDVETDLLPELYNFTAMSWNVLARRYTDRERLSNCPDYALAWEWRRRLMMDENVLLYGPDLVSLQECEDDAFETFFQPDLKAEGYGSLFEKRGSVLHDGCALFYKKSKFRLVSSARVDFDDLDASKELKPLQYPSATFLTHNIAMCALLEVKAQETHLENVYGKRYVFVVNTHHFWDPQAPHVKLLQGHYLLERLEAFKHKMHTTKNIPLDTPVVLMGDLNSGHTSALYKYVTQGTLSPHIHQSTLPQMNMNTFASASGNTGANQGPFSTSSSSSTAHSSSSSSSSSSSAKPQYDRNVSDLIRVKQLTHDMKFYNAHQAHGEAVTNLTINFAGCLDYIFHSPNIVPLAVLENPTTSEDKELRNSILTDDYMGCIPNPAYPSDHLPLMVQFGFTLNLKPTL